MASPDLNIRKLNLVLEHIDKTASYLKILIAHFVDSQGIDFDLVMKQLVTDAFEDQKSGNPSAEMPDSPKRVAGRRKERFDSSQASWTRGTARVGQEKEEEPDSDEDEQKQQEIEIRRKQKQQEDRYTALRKEYLKHHQQSQQSHKTCKTNSEFPGLDSSDSEESGDSDSDRIPETDDPVERRVLAAVHDGGSGRSKVPKGGILW